LARYLNDVVKKRKMLRELARRPQCAKGACCRICPLNDLEKEEKSRDRKPRTNRPAKRNSKKNLGREVYEKKSGSEMSGGFLVGPSSEKRRNTQFGK